MESDGAHDESIKPDEPRGEETSVWFLLKTSITSRRPDALNVSRHTCNSIKSTERIAGGHVKKRR